MNTTDDLQHTLVTGDIRQRIDAFDALRRQCWSGQLLDDVHRADVNG